MVETPTVRNNLEMMSFVRGNTHKVSCFEASICGSKIVCRFVYVDLHIRELRTNLSFTFLVPICCLVFRFVDSHTAVCSFSYRTSYLCAGIVRFRITHSTFWLSLLSPRMASQNWLPQNWGLKYRKPFWNCSAYDFCETLDYNYNEIRSNWLMIWQDVMGDIKTASKRAPVFWLRPFNVNISVVLVNIAFRFVEDLT